MLALEFVALHFLFKIKKKVRQFDFSIKSYVYFKGGMCDGHVYVYPTQNLTPQKTLLKACKTSCKAFLEFYYSD